MQYTHVVIVLLCFIPGVRGIFRAAKEPEQTRGRGTLPGLLILNLAAAALLITLLYYESLV